MEIKTFVVEGKLQEFVTSRPILKDSLKEVFVTKKKY